ncbi:MAG: isochorismatase family protein [Liquorilactobacillus sp.]|uniref:isochorismatase family protein n=1 Tax=Liquorilactobacillus sp. TaxID=2767923 RepID=UPI0039E8709E
MADYLIVIDVQTDYLSQDKNYNSYDLISAINNKISIYPTDKVIYVVNRFFWELDRKKKKLVPDLKKVSAYVYEKRHASCLTNDDLREFLWKHSTKSIEFVGLDGNYCISASIKAVSNRGYNAIVDLNCIGVKNHNKFKKTLKKWRSAKVVIE